MKNLITFLICLLSVTVFAANPTYNSFLPSDFTNNGINIGLNQSTPKSFTNPTNNFVGSMTANGGNVVTNYLTPIDFGAKGNGEVMTNIAIAAGSRTLTIAGGGQKYGWQFTTNDVGKFILLYGAGQPQIGLYTTTNCLSTGISNWISSTQVILSNAALNTVVAGQRNAFAVYGNDDTAAIQAWLNYSTNFFYHGGTNKTHYSVPDKIFPIAGPIIDPVPVSASASGYNNYKNSQVIFPDYPTIGDFARALIIEGDSIVVEHESTTGVSSFGSIFWSFYVSTNYCYPYLNTITTPRIQLYYTPSVFSCQNWAGVRPFTGVGSDGYTNNFNGFRPIWKNLTVRTPANPNINALDIRGATSAEFDHVLVNTGTRTSSDYAPIFTNVSGIITPPSFCDDNNKISSCEVNSFWDGIHAGEHLGIHDTSVEGCQNALFCHYGGHWVVLDNCDFEANKVVFYNSGSKFEIIGNTTGEFASISGGQWWSPPVIFDDWNNVLSGEIWIRESATTNWVSSTLGSGGTNVVLHRVSASRSDGSETVQEYFKTKGIYGTENFYYRQNLNSGALIGNDAKSSAYALIISNTPGQRYIQYRTTEALDNSWYELITDVNSGGSGSYILGKGTLGTLAFISGDPTAHPGYFYANKGAYSGFPGVGGNDGSKALILPLGAEYGTNTWSDTAATNGMQNFATRIVSSNNIAAVLIYRSNDVVFLKQLFP